MSDWAGILSSIPGWISLYYVLKEKRRGKPILEAVGNVRAWQSSGKGDRCSLAIKVRNRGKGWARITKIRWNVFELGSEEVLSVGELDTIPSPYIFSPDCMLESNSTLAAFLTMFAIVGITAGATRALSYPLVYTRCLSMFSKNIANSGFPFLSSTSRSLSQRLVTCSSYSVI